MGHNIVQQVRTVVNYDNETDWMDVEKEEWRTKR